MYLTWRGATAPLFLCPKKVLVKSKKYGIKKLETLRWSKNGWWKMIAILIIYAVLFVVIVVAGIFFLIKIHKIDKEIDKMLNDKTK